MKIIIKALEIFFLDLALKQRKWIISRSEKRIEKLKFKLGAETIYQEMLLKDTLKLCDKFKLSSND